MKDFDIYITEAQQFALAAERYGKQNDINHQKKFAVEAAERYLLAGSIAKNPRDKDFALGHYRFWIDLAYQIQRKTIQSSIRTNTLDDNAPKFGKFEPIKKTNITFDDVAGLENVKNYIRTRIILTMKHKDAARRFKLSQKGGLILYGPPGTGKTLIAKAIAGETNSTFYSVKSSDIMSKWVGDAEKNVERLFAKARQTKPSLIYIDEIDGLIRKRNSTSSSVAPRVVSQFLTELDGVQSEDDSLEGVFFIGSTNVPWELDNALRTGRIDLKVYVPPPDFKARKRIFEINLDNIPIESNIDFEELARLTKGYMGSDISYVCSLARQKAFKSLVDGEKERVVMMGDIIDAIFEVPPSVDQSTVKKYEDYAKIHLNRRS